jgi:hypothetical protein
MDWSSLLLLRDAQDSYLGLNFFFACGIIYNDITGVIVYAADESADEHGSMLSCSAADEDGSTANEVDESDVEASSDEAEEEAEEEEAEEEAEASSEAEVDEEDSSEESTESEEAKEVVESQTVEKLKQQIADLHFMLRQIKQ